jgi:hypothetical protein
MHKLLLTVAAASLLFAAVPASAEDVGVSIGERGVRVGVDRDHDRDGRRERHIYTDGRASRDCAEVTTKKRMPDGTVVIKKSQRC